MIGTMFALVNQARAQTQKCGSKTMPAVGPVDYSDEIAKAAQAHAQDMADKTYFSHDSLDGRAFDQRIAATKYRGSPGGEHGPLVRHPHSEQSPEVRLEPVPLPHR